jgi:DNA-binding NarL/FixJ family response regulator
MHIKDVCSTFPRVGVQPKELAGVGPPIRVVVGEDQPLFREGVVHVLQEAGLEVVGVAADADDLVRKATAHAPNLVVADIEMPPSLGQDGLRAAQEIRRTLPAVSVLVLSQFLEERYVLDLLADRPEGAGYLLKDRVADVDSFVDSVRRVARGGSVIDAEVVGRLVGSRRQRDPLETLTRREREVLSLMAEGKSNQGVADTLFVTVAAVERHVTGIFSKLGLPQDLHGHRRVLAVLRYLRNGHPAS